MFVFQFFWSLNNQVSQTVSSGTLYSAKVCLSTPRRWCLPIDSRGMRGLLASFWTIVNLSHKWRRSISLFEPERVCCISITHCIYYNLQAAWFFVSIYTHTRLIIPRNLRTCMLCAWILINTPTLISMNLSHPLNGVRAHIYKSDVITTIYTNPLLCLVFRVILR